MSSYVESILESIAKSNDGRLPKASVLAKRAQMSEEEARQEIDAFKKSHSEWLRSLAIPAKEPEQIEYHVGPASDPEIRIEIPENLVPEATVPVKKEGPLKKLGHALDSLTDKGSLWFAVIIDLILNGIGFWIIGPDPIMKLGMVCVSVIVVLFSVRAWIKGNKVLWLNFALVASFMDISFILLATDVQSQNASQDTELTRLIDQADKDQKYLEALQAKQLEKGSGYKDQITQATASRDNSNAALERYRANQGTTMVGHYQMSASKVFTAIPDAIMSGRWDRWIATIILTMVFAGLQFTIISATGVKWNGKRD